MGKILEKINILKKNITLNMQDTIINELPQYQWIKGENFGLFENEVRRDKSYIYFDSGKRMSLELLSEFMRKITSEKDVIQQFDSTVENITEVSVKSSTVPKKTERIEVVEEKEEKGEVSLNVEDDAIINTLKKHLDNTKLSKTFSTKTKVNLPEQSIYEFLCEMYGEKVFKEKLKYLLLQQLTSEFEIRIDDFLEQTYKKQ